MSFIRNFWIGVVIIMGATAGASAQQNSAEKPITILGINAFMSEPELEATLNRNGYKCSLQDENIPRLAKLVCSKNMYKTAWGGGYASITVRRSTTEIELRCLAIADALGESDCGTRTPIKTRDVIMRLARAGVFKPEHERRRTGPNSACFKSALGDEACVDFVEGFKQSLMTIRRPK